MTPLTAIGAEEPVTTGSATSKATRIAAAFIWKGRSDQKRCQSKQLKIGSNDGKSRLGSRQGRPSEVGRRSRHINEMQSSKPRMAYRFVDSACKTYLKWPEERSQIVTIGTRQSISVNDVQVT